MKTKPFQVKYETPQIKQVIDTLTQQIKNELPEIPNPRWVAVRLLDGDRRIIEALQNGDLGNLKRGDTTDRAHQIKVIGNQ
ncbi:MAG: hypothetical protein ACQ5SW_10875 [Sphaerochaetaceae bacterium]